MKKLMRLTAILALVLVAATPALAQVEGPNFDDQELESGGIDTETNISIEGNNNNQCAGLLQANNAGNFANQQGTLQYALPNAGDNEFAGPETDFAPDNATDCQQQVQQSSAASSSGWDSSGWDSW